MQLKDNDMILLSIQNENQIGISQGFIKTISNDKRTFVLMLDKNLDSKDNNCLFRIDKVNYRSSICQNYSNLIKLMEPTEHAAKLRELIIERRKPTFERALSKQYILKVKTFLKSLNQNQQLASIKVCLELKIFYLCLLFFLLRVLWLMIIFLSKDTLELVIIRIKSFITTKEFVFRKNINDCSIDCSFGKIR